MHRSKAFDKDRKIPKQDTANSSESSRPLCADGLLGLRESAAFLGIARTSMYALLKSGALPYARICGGHKRIPKRALVAFAESKLVGPR